MEIVMILSTRQYWYFCITGRPAGAAGTEQQQFVVLHLEPMPGSSSWNGSFPLGLASPDTLGAGFTYLTLTDPSVVMAIHFVQNRSCAAVSSATLASENVRFSRARDPLAGYRASPGRKPVTAPSFDKSFVASASWSFFAAVDKRPRICDKIRT
jgi:hypothetical protein